MSGLDAVLARIAEIQSLVSGGTASSAAVPGSSASATDFANTLDSTDSMVSTDSTDNTDSTDSTVSSGSAGAAAAFGTAGEGSGGGVTGAQVVTDAQQYLGIPYVWGGTTTSGFDCSGLVQHVYADLGVSLPRTSEEQATVGTPVDSLADAQPGDLVFFAGSDGTASSPGHVGIYIGNGQMIDAPYTGTDVRVDNVSSAGPVVAIRRIVATGDVGAATTAAAATTASVPAGGTYAADFASAAASTGVPATLLASVARTESSMDPTAVSPAGAEGLMQLMPSTAASLGVDPWNPASAIDGAARMLASAYQQFGSWSLAVAAYNAGSGAVEQYGGIPPYPQTEAYVTKVLSGAGMGS